MSLRRLAPLAAAALLLAGCGGRGEQGTASLWVTRNRGAQVLLVRTVPAGLTAMQALRREAKVETRYGGRYVQAIDGLEGSLGARRDWFYFVNGIESDRGAAEYRLHDGDVEWWDFRSWQRRMEQPVVVGAFPEPFLHGFGGKTRPAVVRYASPGLAEAARAIGRVIRAVSVRPTSVPVPGGANVFELATGPPRFTASHRGADTSAGSPVQFVLGGDAARLGRRPSLARYRYEGLP